MPYRKIILANNEIYHIYNKSIAGFRIFNSRADYERIIKSVIFYSLLNPPSKLSLFLKKQRQNSKPASELAWDSLNCSLRKLVRIIAYCIMPTHIHLLMQQLENNGISKFMNLLLKSYSKYFNEKYNRKGPLWEGRFKNVLVETNEQFLHLTRYIHLNPVTAGLVNVPEEWKYSSYLEYLALIDKSKMVCNFNSYLDMEATSYKKFVKDGISYEKALSKIKNLTLD